MSNIQTNVAVNSIDHSRGHILFVEGAKNFDSKVIKVLFDKHCDKPITVEQLGSCRNIKNLAKALFESHENLVNSVNTKITNP